MIYYDSHKWSTLLGIQGSVFPMATLLAIPSALAAFILKYLVNADLVRLDMMNHFGNSNSVYSGFTFVLGFSLVFRTSESYHRFWTAATSCHEMGSEWSDCCSSLIAFVQVSKKPPEVVQQFTHRVVRLFCLLHAMAMEEIAHLQEGNFPLIDIAGLNQQDLKALLADECHGKRVQVVLSWIKICIIEAWDNGLLNVPPPILTRVFQELGLGLVEYHKAQQVVIWPFPFPYTQMNLVLIYVYMFVTPLVIVTWDLEPWLAGLGTFFSVLCMIGLDLIASELENPFGEDANDLPVREIHSQMIRILLLLLSPRATRVPRLLPTAVTNFDILMNKKAEDRQSLMQSQNAADFQRMRLNGMMKSASTQRTHKRTPRRKKIKGQLEWARAASLTPDLSRERLAAWLSLRLNSGPISDEELQENGSAPGVSFEDELESHVYQSYSDAPMSDVISAPHRVHSASSSRLQFGQSLTESKLVPSGSKDSRLGESLMESRTSDFTAQTTPPTSGERVSQGGAYVGRLDDVAMKLQTHFQEQVALLNQMHQSQMNALRLLMGDSQASLHPSSGQSAQSDSGKVVSFPAVLGHDAPALPEKVDLALPDPRRLHEPHACQSQYKFPSPIMEELEPNISNNNNVTGQSSHEPTGSCSTDVSQGVRLVPTRPPTISRV
mmetsp:Transcript_5961/g.13124  ORF Transcript_5961/g.13124 Transcript_5961/m.13124 type:complete len:664 (+) Transcript_5961:97-2088(+)